MGDSTAWVVDSLCLIDVSTTSAESLLNQAVGLLGDASIKLVTEVVPCLKRFDVDATVNAWFVGWS